MTAIELRFPAHRFHANPWGRHVNEGVAEWPPSPYRLIRALYDAWKRKRPDLPEAAVSAVLKELSAEPPCFQLPRATTSHTRSYLSSNSEDPNDKSLIFDAFVALDPGAACYVIWPTVTLDGAQRNLLDELLHVLNYVGRSESWIEARLQRGEAAPLSVTCEPAGVGENSGDLVPLACPLPASEYRGKRPWLDALTYSTSELLKQRRSAPPAMRTVPYVRPQEALVTHVPRQPRESKSVTQAVLLSLDSTVLPLSTATVEVAEQIRAKLMGIHKRIAGDPALVSPTFAGKTRDGKPDVGHSHVFIMPISNGKGRIHRVLLYVNAVAGFERNELRAILQLRSLWQSAGRPDVRCVATWRGMASDEKLRPLANTAVSTTPFATVRHWRKGRGEPIDFLREEVRRECRNHGLPPPSRIELWEAPPPFEWVEFRRNRKNDPPRDGHGFRLQFEMPVRVPFGLGYGCHFGLGQFDREPV
jgi:CRISPR-associated protein Csb2